MANEYKKINPACIFCGHQKDTHPIYVAPLDHQFKPICNSCLPTLNRFIKKYPDLFEV